MFFMILNKKYTFKLLLKIMLALLSVCNAQANTFYGDINIDGDLSDWTVIDRLNIPQGQPPYLAVGDELYGKYVDSPEPTYLIAFKFNTGPSIVENTTLYLNTDQDAMTGYQIGGYYGGIEYFVNVFYDLTPHLYNETFAWQGGLVHAYSADNTVLELAIPMALLEGVIPPQDIDILADINDVVFLPADYSINEPYILSGQSNLLPPRTDFNKRVAIVFGETTKNHFFSEKAYSQLFMAMQHQAMMAGIPFDFLTEYDLTDITNIVNYDALIFPYFANVPQAIFDEIHDTLYKAIYHYGIGIIAAGNLLTNDENNVAFSGDAYQYMKQLIGVGRVDGNGPAEIAVTATDINHPVMKNYGANEAIFNYTDRYYSYFTAVPNQAVTILASQMVTGNYPGTYNAVIAIETGGRNVHFATLGFMGDANLVWQALQWVIYGDETPVALKMGRHDNLFISRNDADQAQEYEEVPFVHFPLYDLLVDWKNNYNFVGSYYIDIGNDPNNGQWTDWNISAPLFQDYIALGNEIGTHSWAHPHDTDALTPSEIEFEFNQSMDEISTQLGATWQGINIRGAAIPGAPEQISTAAEIIQYVDYLSGSYSGVGAGYPGAFGYLTPQFDKIYLSPNMTFDFTLIQYGVPVGYPPAVTPLTAEEAEYYWQNEYNELMRHASQPIIVWPWHDYGPTTEADPLTGSGYSLEMYENTIAMAYNDNAEFATLADVAQRIETFKEAHLAVNQDGNMITARVDTIDVGKFSLKIATSSGPIIQNVDNWYAYDDDQIFLDQDGGLFTIHLGHSPDEVTHITALPMRANLISVNGDGTELNYTFEGEGEVTVTLNAPVEHFDITGANSITILDSTLINMNFVEYGTHVGSIMLK